MTREKKYRRAYEHLYEKRNQDGKVTRLPYIIALDEYDFLGLHSKIHECEIRTSRFQKKKSYRHMYLFSNRKRVLKPTYFLTFVNT